MDARAIRDAAEAMRPRLVELRRAFHREPELGRRETATADAICAELDALGIGYERRLTAVVGLVRGALPGGCVALRADIDALPIREETGAPYASRREGAMHACGHDAHAAIQLGAARYFAGRRANLAGDVKLLFQPDEEGEGGAEDMVRAGCLERPRVDAVFGLHVMPYLPVGTVELKKGALNGSSTTLHVAVRGVSGHGAYPETGIDAILIAANVVTALNSLVSRYASPLDQAVLTIGTIAGGKRSNIIADEVRMEATMRTTSDALRDSLLERARSLVEGIASSYGGSGELSVVPGYASLVNHDAEIELVAEAASLVLGAGALRWKEKPSMGVEDFSFFIKDRPGAFYHLGCVSPGKAPGAGLHSPHFDIDEDCLPLGAAVQAAAAELALERLAGKGRVIA